MKVVIGPLVTLTVRQHPRVAPRPTCAAWRGYPFTLTCHVEELVDRYRVRHELRKRIFKRFNEEGVEMPFPIRTVHLKKE